MTGLVAAGALCGSAMAVEPFVYTPDFFEQFAPQNAADMVARIPGFTIRGSEEGERGFGQASLNILINGRRPSSKSLSANDILERISVERVARIEVVDGTQLDIPGLSGDVANIITESIGITGNWEYSARFEEGTQPQLLEGEGSVSLSRGDVTVTLSADIGQFRRTEDGEEVFFDADLNPIEDRVEKLVRDDERPSFDVALNWTPPSGNVLNLNGQVQLYNRNIDLVETFSAVGPGGNDGQTILFDGEDEINYELGGDYAFGAGPESWDGTLKLIGLYRFENSEFTTRLQDFTIGEANAFTEFLQDIDETEAIARAEYSFAGGAWQVASEYAYNELEALQTFNGSDFPRVRVTENRVEGTVSHNRRLGTWDLQASLGAEYSELAVPTAAASEPREFVRPKGFLSASRDLDTKHSLVLRVDRTVGQLNFFDFIDDVDLEEGRDDAGNERIKPDQTWLLSATLERTDPKGFSWRINPEVGIVEDPIDRVRFADGTEGPGNLDSNAYFYGGQANFTLVLDDLVQGMRLEGSGSYFETDIEDQLTFDRRQFNGNVKWRTELSLRHDIANTPWAYEIEWEESYPDIRAFRFNEIAGIAFESELDAEIEHKDVFGMNLRVRFQDILDEGNERFRDVFTPDRLGDFILREERVRRSGRRVSLILSDTF